MEQVCGGGRGQAGRCSVDHGAWMVKSNRGCVGGNDQMGVCVCVCCGGGEEE